MTKYYCIDNKLSEQAIDAKPLQKNNFHKATWWIYYEVSSPQTFPFVLLKKFTFV